ncbi:eIF-2alpha kinase PEK/EIF2AK3 [Handroanthus impetiginosus]|uniref:eIF-2alpha kinase PEK/EIF2AK3 n=1 Tax=Handroanthus impetiginosus TaxID=429701 RepID=A0A2G9G2C6_9LAMI|nr:eIF-2alpha kinase PEK/EIF2AK3 [Handroanthus impetiginosus]
MEHPTEEIAAKAEAARAEIRRKAHDITINTTEPEGFRFASPTFRVFIGQGSAAVTTLDMVKDRGLDRGETSFVVSASTLTNSCPMNYAGVASEESAEGFRFKASSALHASTSSEWARSSTLSNIDTVKRPDGSVVSLAHSGPASENPCPINAGLTVENMRNYGYPNGSVVGCSSTKQEIIHGERCSYHLESGWPKSRIGDGGMTSEDKGCLELSSKEDLTGMPQSFEDAEHLLSTRNNVDLGRTSTHLTEGSGKIISSDRHLVSSRSKALNSASFYNSFLEQTRKTTRTAFTCINSMGLNRTTSMLMSQTENSSEGASIVMNRNLASHSLHSDNTFKERPELPHHEINLREWLESNGSKASKNDKLHLFRQIVETVDVAHAQGIAFLDLWPSSFILLEAGHVKYIGPVMDVELSRVKKDNTKKRGLEPETFAHDKTCVKLQKVDENRLIRREASCSSRFVYSKRTDQFIHGIIDTKNCYPFKSTAQNVSVYKGTSRGKCWTTDNAQLEKKWYAFQEGFNIRDLFSFNIYCLGLLLFEFLCHFESMEAHSAAMMDLHDRILPPCFLSENPKEAGFCFWLLHPEPSSRPTTREILRSELIYGSGSTSLSLSNDEALCDDIVDDAEPDLLLHFLVSLKKYMQNKASNLLGSMEILDFDIKEVERRHASRKYLETRGGGYDQRRKPYEKDGRNTGIPYSPSSRAKVLRDKLLGNIDQLENAYFSVRSHEQLTDMPDMDRSDKDVLRNRDRCSWGQEPQNLKGKSVDRVGTFFEGICKFARYSKFEVCGTLRNGDILNSNNVICSLSFDREEEYVAAAGVSKKIKIFELGSLLNDDIDVQYPVLEMTNKSKFSCICWNNYIKNYLASTDYDGVVQMWDASTGQGFAQYKEHQKRAWSVDFSQADPMKFATGGDDCSVRIWNINE